MARKHGVITKYNPAIAYSSQSIQADMQESKEGRYVELQDYENAIGVIRKLKTKLAKKERRAVKLRKPETVEPSYLTLEEKRQLWDKSTQYGRNRYELLDFLIEQVQAMIQEIDDYIEEHDLEYLEDLK